jgi:ABC-type polysaccharide/polyol phosphate transport system ATPase subunit
MSDFPDLKGGSGSVSVEGVSKRYHLSGTRGLLRSLFFPRRDGGDDDLWALQDVSFSVQPGEAFGIIGHNGAGKSTMLKLLAGIMPVTRGRIDLRGRLACLIEVGAGFHPELTGRENAFLNGVILGMTRREVQQRLDSIVAFAELERFMDVPVKRYSSGMYMRLGFSVAVHAQPEVLLVDEVLAVGDQAFQHRCIDTIGQLRREGTAVVLVSHSFFTVLGTCSRAMWLDHGRIRAMGSAEEVVKEYEQQVQGLEVGQDVQLEDGEMARFRNAELLSPQALPVGSSLSVAVDIELKEAMHPVLGFGLVRSDGTACGAANTRIQQVLVPELSGRHRVELEIPNLRLVPGAYRLLLEVTDPPQSMTLARCGIPFQMTSPIPNLDPACYGVFLPEHHWKVDGNPVQEPRVGF